MYKYIIYDSLHFLRYSMYVLPYVLLFFSFTGTNWPSPSYTLLVTGLCRFKIEDLLQETPYYVARVKQLDKLSTVDKQGNYIDRMISIILESQKKDIFQISKTPWIAALYICLLLVVDLSTSYFQHNG